MAAVRPLDVDSYSLSVLQVCAHASRTSYPEREGSKGRPGPDGAYTPDIAPAREAKNDPYAFLEAFPKLPPTWLCRYRNIGTRANHLHRRTARHPPSRARHIIYCPQHHSENRSGDAVLCGIPTSQRHKTSQKTTKGADAQSKTVLPEGLAGKDECNCW